MLDPMRFNNQRACRSSVIKQAMLSKAGYICLGRPHRLVPIVHTKALSESTDWSFLILAVILLTSIH